MQVIRTEDGSYTLMDACTQEMYHSSSGALLESSSLYIESSSIKKKFSEDGHVAVLDVGLGLGYNACSTIEAWYNQDSAGCFWMLSIEKNKDLVAELLSGAARWQRGWKEEWKSWCQQLKYTHRQSLRAEFFHPVTNRFCVWEIFIGDALSYDWLYLFRYKWDFIWQDPFSPKVEASLWRPEWFSFLSHQASSECQLMTYSVCRETKTSLEKGGWRWKKIPTLGQKKSWLKASPFVFSRDRTLSSKKDLGFVQNIGVSKELLV